MSEDLKVAYNFAIDDLNSISDNPDDWISEYIAPIEAARSQSEVNLSKTDKKTDPLSKMKISLTRNESMAHAFLRYMGFPIVSPKSKQFYNAGFNPYISREDEGIDNINIDFNSSDLRLLTFYRETDYINRLQIFARQDNASTLYALSLRFIKPFNVLKTSKGPLDVDNQTGTIESRSNIVNSFYKTNTNLSNNKSGIESYLSKTIPGKTLTRYKHVLRPFVLDPDVTKAVNPPNKEVCAPFLANTAEATRNGPNKSDQLYRPFIEQLIRGRLEATYKADDTYKNFLNNIKNIYENNTSPPESVSNLNYGTLRATVVALADNNNADKADIDEIFGEFTPIQIIRVSHYIKLIKVAVKVLYQSINTINDVLKSTNWVPIPDKDGPRYIKRAKVDRKKIANTRNLDKEIADCRAAKAACQAISNIGFSLKYPLPNLGVTNKDYIRIYSERLDKLENIRNKFSAKAFQALRNIEIITGEISGLGIIDIWAVHAALWALDEVSLINFLDDSAFNRMIVFNPELITSNVKDRLVNNKKQNIETTLKKFESILINILSFADKEYERQFDNPTKKDGGGVNS